MAQKSYESIRDDYKTPPAIYETLLKFAGVEKFDLDVCCSDENIPALRYNKKCEVDGLATEWRGVCFCNPPFKEAQKWVRKAVEQVKKHGFGAEVWFVLPADRFENKFYQECIVQNPHCCFAFLPKKQGFIVPGEEDKPLKPSQKIVIAVFSRRAAEHAYGWNFYDLFNTKAFTGVAPAPKKKPREWEVENE
jgi:hypothetical protein